MSKLDNLDIYIVGLGGQGILTIGDLLADAALNMGLPVNFYPTKGMSQRGGFVEGQLRIGSDKTGPSLSPQSADVVIAMERSEALAAVRYIRPDGEFLLYNLVWAPAQVMLGKAEYPETDGVINTLQNACNNVRVIDPEERPEYNGSKVRDNLYVLGAAIANTALGKMFDYEQIKKLVEQQWAKAAAENIFTLDSGYHAKVKA